MLFDQPGCLTRLEKDPLRECRDADLLRVKNIKPDRYKYEGVIIGTFLILGYALADYLIP
jgi:hypothetical protein